MGRRQDRTFTGCSRCRARKVKCDETRPGCKTCARLGTRCPGFGSNFVWVRSGDSKASGFNSGFRRTLACEETWRGFQTLSEDLIDLLISQRDETPSIEGAHDMWLPAGHNPFGVFQLNDEENVLRPDCLTLIPDSNSPPPLSVARNLIAFPDSSHDERFLFHHYVTHVATLMLPYDHPRNPWKMYYPAAALNQVSPHQKALHSALLAHAAFNVAHLRDGDPHTLEFASRHYGMALRHLLPHFTRDHNVEFTVMIAAVISLIFAEVYSGQSRMWRFHFKGAWTLLEQYREAEPWKLADSVCVSLQSLIIIKIIGGTSEDGGNSNGRGGGLNESALQGRHHVSEVDESPKALTPILSTSEFGFTIGAPRVVLQCIASITQYRDMEQRGTLGLGATEDLLQKVLSRLNDYRESYKASDDYDGVKLKELEGDIEMLSPNPRQLEETWSKDQRSGIETMAQRKAFLYATYIFLYRVLLNVPPTAVSFYVSKTFENVSCFFASSSGNFSIWPAFIAAAEAYTEKDIAAAQRWLKSATSFGLGNRYSIQRVLEEVWRRRRAVAITSGMDLGSIAIDWRKVMHELDCDVLIV